MKNMNFQVNLQGIIDLLSNHLYSDPGVFVRELLQNGTDAVTARQRMGQVFEGHIKVELFSSGALSFTDNGCGLTEEDVALFLSRIGSSIKRTEPDRGDDYIGQFGVGLLSCFVVSEEIVMITRSAQSDEPLEWRGKPDGTYTLRRLTQEVPVGTTVYLKAKPDYEEYFTYYRLEDLLRKYGEFLPTPIYLTEDACDELLNGAAPPWSLDKPAAVDYVQGILYEKPLDIIPLASTIGGVRGIAYVLPHAVSLQDERKHRVYLKNMLLSDQMTNLLPAWAFFVQGILNTDHLRPTASREAFQENDLFHAVKEELGESIKRYLLQLSESDPGLFERIILIHQSSIKTMAVHDEDLYAVFIRHLTFETSFGEMKMESILRQRTTILVTSSLDEFRQVNRVAKAQEMMVINGGYVHDLDLVRRLPRIEEDIQVAVLDPMAFAERFTRPDEEEQAAARILLEHTDELLSRFQCRSLIRWFEPADMPVLYNTSREANFFKLADESEQEAGPVFQAIIRAVKQELYEPPLASICYNYNNPMVRKALNIRDPQLRKSAIELFYTQALLLGHHPMHTEELRMMNDSLLVFMNRGLAQAGEVDHDETAF
ncbi:HSP90 family protein [Paenibacillus sp. 1P07SE]|uniref:HSP90 family protein n=1 Tax=Paenibacillus sp. 1P07SE TaxID=3132209 RepID=UPI0039A69BAE